MYERWAVLEDETMPEIAEVKEPKYHLIVGTSGRAEPYTYYKGNELWGYDIELARRFALWLNADLEFKVYNYDTKSMEEYVVHAEDLYANPEEQIKMICITIQDSLKRYCYNPIAILEHHNKGCGSVAASLDEIMKEHGYSSREEVLTYEDPNEIFRHMPEIGDPRYSQKICYCANECLDRQVFGEGEHQIVFYDYENNVEHVTNFSVNVHQRS